MRTAVMVYGSKMPCRQGQATIRNWLMLPHKTFAVFTYFWNIALSYLMEIGMDPKVTSFQKEIVISWGTCRTATRTRLPLTRAKPGSRSFRLGQLLVWRLWIVRIFYNRLWRRPPRSINERRNAGQDRSSSPGLRYLGSSGATNVTAGM